MKINLLRAPCTYPRGKTAGNQERYWENAALLEFAALGDILRRADMTRISPSVRRIAYALLARRV